MVQELKEYLAHDGFLYKTVEDLNKEFQRANAMVSLLLNSDPSVWSQGVSNLRDTLQNFRERYKAGAVSEIVRALDRFPDQDTVADFRKNYERYVNERSIVATYSFLLTAADVYNFLSSAKQLLVDLVPDLPPPESRIEITYTVNLTVKEVVQRIEDVQALHRMACEILEMDESQTPLQLYLAEKGSFKFIFGTIVRAAKFINDMLEELIRFRRLTGELKRQGFVNASQLEIERNKAVDMLLMNKRKILGKKQMETLQARAVEIVDRSLTLIENAESTSPDKPALPAPPTEQIDTSSGDKSNG